MSSCEWLYQLVHGSVRHVSGKNGKMHEDAYIPHEWRDVREEKRMCEEGEKHMNDEHSVHEFRRALQKKNYHVSLHS